MAKRAAYYGLMISLAFIFSYIETLIPINFGIPGIKLGLANIVILVTLYLLGEKAAFFISILRVILVGFTFAGMATTIYSLAGGLLSLGIMILFKKLKLFSIVGISILGGISHNIGQLAAAVLVVKTINLIFYLPVLLISGALTGMITGILGNIIVKSLKKFQNEIEQ